MHKPADCARPARGLHGVPAALLAALLGCCGAAAHAQPGPAWPVKPVRMIAPFPPGGSSDLIARVVAQKMSEALAGGVIVDNRPGAGSNLGTAMAARAAPDGYTVLVSSVTAAVNMTLVKNPGYDLLKDFAPVSTLAVGPTALVLHPSVPAKSVLELIQLVFASMPVVVQHMKTGRLRTLAVTGAQRTPLAPELPTMAESGVPGYAFDSWWGLVTNAGVPRRIVEQMNAVVRRGQQSPDVRERFAELGIDPLHSSPEELAAFTRAEMARLAKIIRETGMQAD